MSSGYHKLNSTPGQRYCATDQVGAGFHLRHTTLLFCWHLETRLCSALHRVFFFTLEILHILNEF
ncbi:hypothetical protein Pelo_17767 [Pelomyxa schiedti]|nr:hypothetical protein Pelo_17767 [Pelomyxa schiedti]